MKRSAAALPASVPFGTRRRGEREPITLIECFARATELTIKSPVILSRVAYYWLLSQTSPRELNKEFKDLKDYWPGVFSVATAVTFIGSTLLGAGYMLLSKDTKSSQQPLPTRAPLAVPPMATLTLRGTNFLPTQIPIMTPLAPPKIEGGDGGNGDDDKKPPTEKSPNPKVTASRTPTSISAAQTRAAAEASATRAATQQATADKTPTKPATQVGSEMPALPPDHKNLSYRPYSGLDMVFDKKPSISFFHIPGAETHSGGFFAVNLGENLWGLKHKSGKVVVIRLPYVPHPKNPQKCTPEIGKRYFVPAIAITEITNRTAMEDEFRSRLGGGTPPIIEPADLDIYSSISGGVYKEFVDLNGAIAFYCYAEITK